MLVAMDVWPRFERACLDLHGVGDATLAADHGVSSSRFFDRTKREQWGHPVRGVRVHPDAPPSVQQRLVIVSRTTRDLVAASRQTAAWLHGLRDRPPECLTMVVRHATTCRPYGRVTVRRARWLVAGDVVDRQHVPTLDVRAMFVSLIGTEDRDLKRLLIDAVHRGLVTPQGILDRLSAIGPIPGCRGLRELCGEIAHRRVESIFQEDVVTVLETLGYRPMRSTLAIATADGVGLNVDVPLRPWKVAVEPEGDAFHRTREQRRADRRREAAFASTDWVRVPVDWRDWHLDRERVLRAIDDAIAAQQRRGIGADVPAPRQAGRSQPGQR